jgi:hypothetical protein
MFRRMYVIIREPSLCVFLSYINLLKPTSYAVHQKFNIQQFYALPTLYLCVFFKFENKR